MASELETYFARLIDRVEDSDLDNQGKDARGFFLPRREILLQKLNMLRDLHGKARAQTMLAEAWALVLNELPFEWLTMTTEEKAAFTHSFIKR